VRKADNLPPSCANVTKFRNLNFLEPSGPVQACNGTALPFLPCMSSCGLSICGQARVRAQNNTQEVVFAH